jgi:2,3,4,5-tetrahydropyridine-2-carboxylate N-succinyltransferase
MSKAGPRDRGAAGQPKAAADLRAAIERYAEGVRSGEEKAALEAFQQLKAELNAGTVRAAERGRDGVWRANAWVKAGILLGFRLGRIGPAATGGPFPFYDKDTYPLRAIGPDQGIRIVPGGSAIRDGCFIGTAVVCMPPMYINVGAYVGEGTMVDSHALVGSCAQIGRRVHLSAAAQIGGVLEPAGALPVIIEDEVLVGGNCGVYEGTVVRERAVLAPGTILSGGTSVFDLVHDRVYRRAGDQPLEIPAGAVVVPGTRPVKSGAGAAAGIGLYTPVIVKYRDEKTDTAVRLEDLLR